MSDRILLAWRRRHQLDANNEHLSDGYISVQTGNTVILKEEFEGERYSQMITRLSKTARARETAEVFLLRLEQSPSIAEQMHPDMARMLREDPVKYIRATTFAPQPAVRRGFTSRVDTKDRVTTTPIRAGVDTLADAFGDHIYLRIRLPDEGSFEVECPECGRWVGFGMKADTGQFLIRCNKGCVNVNAHKTWIAVESFAPAFQAEPPRWAVVLTKTLLERSSPRFYIPREWNERAPWILHGDLKSKYEQYQKEAALCTDKQQVVDP